MARKKKFHLRVDGVIINPMDIDRFIPKGMLPEGTPDDDYELEDPDDIAPDFRAQFKQQA